ncbi:MAG: hypothetical protein AB7L41_06985 [Flavobacteriaceae bacterium]
MSDHDRVRLLIAIHHMLEFAAGEARRLEEPRLARLTRNACEEIVRLTGHGALDAYEDDVEFAQDLPAEPAAERKFGTSR